MRRGVFFIVVSLALVTGLSGCAGLSKVVPYPDASIKGVDVGSIGFTGLTLRFDIEIENPYGTGLPVVGLDYALSSEGKRFLNGELEVTETIPAKESRVLPLSVHLPFKELIELGSSVKEGQDFNYHADLGLKLNAPVVGSIRLPMEADGSFKVPRLP